MFTRAIPPCHPTLDINCESLRTFDLINLSNYVLSIITQTTTYEIGNNILQNQKSNAELLTLEMGGEQAATRDDEGKLQAPKYLMTLLPVMMWKADLCPVGL